MNRFFVFALVGFGAAYLLEQAASGNVRGLGTPPRPTFVPLETPSQTVMDASRSTQIGFRTEWLSRNWNPLGDVEILLG